MGTYQVLQENRPPTERSRKGSQRVRKKTKARSGHFTLLEQHPNFQLFDQLLSTSATSKKSKPKRSKPKSKKVAVPVEIVKGVSLNMQSAHRLMLRLFFPAIFQGQTTGNPQEVTDEVIQSHFLLPVHQTAALINIIYCFIESYINTQTDRADLQRALRALLASINAILTTNDIDKLRAISSERDLMFEGLALIAIDHSTESSFPDMDTVVAVLEEKTFRSEELEMQQPLSESSILSMNEHITRKHELLQEIARAAPHRQSQLEEAAEENIAYLANEIGILPSTCWSIENLLNPSKDLLDGYQKEGITKLKTKLFPNNLLGLAVDVLFIKIYEPIFTPKNRKARLPPSETLALFLTDGGQVIAPFREKNRETMLIMMQALLLLGDHALPLIPDSGMEISDDGNNQDLISLLESSPYLTRKLLSKMKLPDQISTLKPESSEYKVSLQPSGQRLVEILAGIEKNIMPDLHDYLAIILEQSLIAATPHNPEDSDGDSDTMLLSTLSDYDASDEESDKENSHPNTAHKANKPLTPN